MSLPTLQKGAFRLLFLLLYSSAPSGKCLNSASPPKSLVLKLLPLPSRSILLQCSPTAAAVLIAQDQVLFVDVPSFRGTPVPRLPKQLDKLPLLLVVKLDKLRAVASIRPVKHPAYRLLRDEMHRKPYRRAEQR